MKAWEAAITVLRRTDNPAVMFGDSGLLHLIAEELGWKHDCWHTESRVLRALSKTPGDLVKRHTSCGRFTKVLIFLLPEEAKRREERKL